MSWFYQPDPLMRRLSAAGIAVVFGGLAWSMFTDPKGVLLGVVLFALAISSGCIGAGLRGWSSAAWGLRASLVALAYLAYRGIGHWDPITWAWAVGLALAAIWGQQIAHRNSLGWIIDDRGERQKVEHLNRGTAVYESTTRSQRLVREALAKASRRKTLLWTTPATIALVLVTWHFRDPRVLGEEITAGVLTLIVGSVWLWSTGKEILYLLGYQDMDGAKVLDAAPQRAGVDQVVRQKAHGDASVASEDEARNFLNPRP
jgi:hypothetical protein